MRVLAGVSVLAILVLVAAFQFAPQEITTADQDQIEAEVLEVASGLMAAWNAEDMDGSIAPFVSEDLYVVWGSAIDDTPEAFHDRMTAIWERYPSWEGEWDFTFVRVLSENSALFLGRYHTTITSTDEVSRLFPRVHWTALFEKKADGWKMTVVDHAFGEAEVVEEG